MDNLAQFIKEWSGFAALAIVILQGGDWSGFVPGVLSFLAARFGPDPRVAALEAEIAKLKEASK